MNQRRSEPASQICDWVFVLPEIRKEEGKETSGKIMNAVTDTVLSCERHQETHKER